MEYMQMTLDDWLSVKNELEEELRGAAAGFVRIGYLLRKIEETRGYERDGYDSLTEWAKSCYGLSASAVSRFMAINRKYSIDGYSKQLRLEFAKYGQAKLAEMLTLPDEDMQMVSPDMKREDIREIKAFEREAPKEEPAIESAECPEWIMEFAEQNEIDIETKAFQEDRLASMIEQVIPSGARTFRYKRTMVSMFADRIMVKVFPNPPETMDWRDFFDMIIPVLRKRREEPLQESSEVYEDAQEMPAETQEVPAEAAKMPAEAVKVPDTKEKSTEKEPDRQRAEPPKEEPPKETGTEPFAPAQENPPHIEEFNVKTDSEEEVEQVEIDDILPAPEEPDRLQDLKDRFLAELNSLKILLDSGCYGTMQKNIERLEHLRRRMIEEVE